MYKLVAMEQKVLLGQPQNGVNSMHSATVKGSARMWGGSPVDRRGSDQFRRADLQVTVAYLRVGDVVAYHLTLGR